MKVKEIQAPRIEGKTYSLFGNSDTSNEYFQSIEFLASKILESNPEIISVIETISNASSKRNYSRKINLDKDQGPGISDWMDFINSELIQYTQKANEHLLNLPLAKIWDKRLATSRQQYHLYMLEIELINRLNSVNFINSDKKIALLPYCLQDFSVNCKADKNDFDNQCKHCSASCFENHASRILRENNVEPYIWMKGDLKKLAKKTMAKGQSFGVLGIACIPELIWGMRKCRRYKIPVIGLPLNANRCVRWFGEFFPNSVNLDVLEKLVKC